MRYSISIEDANRAAAVQGGITFREQGAFRSFLDDLFGGEGESYVIDLSGVETIDSAGLGLLLIARNQSLEIQKQVVLRKPNDTVRHALTNAHFDSVFPIED